METLGMNWEVFFVNILIVGGWLLSSIIALLALRRSHLTGTNQAIWALLIVAIPIFGALAFFLVRPSENSQY